MGTISEKLSYLNTTKVKIKDGINRLGGDLTNLSTFRSYASVLNAIYNALPKVSGEGSNISLSPTLKGGLDIKPKGACEQDSTTGKNKLAPAESFNVTNNGITFTSDGNGKYTISGTASTGGFILATDSPLINYTIKENDYLHLKNEGSQLQNAIGLAFYTNSGYFTVTFNTTDRIISLANYVGQTILSINAYANNGLSINQTCTPMIVNNVSTSTTWEKYTGGIPAPSPSYEMPIRVVTGENSVVVQNKNYYIGNEINSNSSYNSTFPMSNNCIFKDYVDINNIPFPFTVATKVKLKGEGYEGTNIRFNYYDENKNYLGINYGHYYVSAVQSNDYQTIMSAISLSDLPQNTKYIFITIRIQDGGETKETEILLGDYTIDNLPPYVAHQEQTKTLNLGSNYLAGIGDYKDKIVGKTDDWKKANKAGKVIYDGSDDENWKMITSGNMFYIENDEFLPPSTITELGIIISNYYTKDTYRHLYDGVGDYSIGLNNTNRLGVRNKDITSVEDLKIWLSTHNLIVYYLLNTPTEEPITDTTLISQLNEMYELMGYDGQTNISISSATGNAQMIAQVSALKGE